MRKRPGDRLRREGVAKSGEIGLIGGEISGDGLTPPVILLHITSQASKERSSIASKKAENERTGADYKTMPRKLGCGAGLWGWGEDRPRGGLMTPQDRAMPKILKMFGIRIKSQIS